MKLNVSYIRSHYPRIFGIRKTLQSIKVKRIKRFMLSDDDILICEKDSSKIEKTIKPYIEKWATYLHPTIEEANYLIENAPKYRNMSSKNQIRTDMIFCRLAYGFIPSEYAGFAFELKSPNERKSYVSDLDISEFGYTVNDIVEIQKFLNKARMVKQISKFLKRDVLLISSVEDFTSFVKFVRKHPIFVKKETFSCKGKGVELVNLSKKGSVKDYFEQLINNGIWLLEELVVQSDEMAIFNETSVNTVRVRTFNTKNGIDLKYCNFRTGRQGSFVDNGGSGGLLIGVNADTGIINTNGYDEFGEEYAEHPDSHIPFIGYAIPDWEGLKDICIRGAQENPNMGYLSWDMAYTKEGWKVIEVNEVGQLVGAQLVSGRGLKREMIEYLSVMKKFKW